MDYKKYKHLQETQGGASSFGSAWGDQMERAILEYFKDKPKQSKIIDVGCGDGRGLLALKDQGFTDVIGIDLSTSRIKDAKLRGLNAHECDFHNMSIFETEQFDYLFCSHTIEHSLNPLVALRECQRISKNGLIICPIDNKPQPPRGESPHTSNFDSVELWKELFNHVFRDTNKKISHLEVHRLGKEVWSEWSQV